ncbi:MAG: hypothetical protein DHS20C15_24160 [Planctomycetota bacterium]|nr:MAG: hypothetical protein DHS20C15_24160 [Planctomycetota bacterium]
MDATFARSISLGLILFAGSVAGQVTPVPEGVSAEDWTDARSAWQAKQLLAQQAYLKASNAESLDFFGQAVAISGDTLVVGAYGEDSPATGVNGYQFNNGAEDAGAAFVFVRDGISWTQQAFLKPSNTEAFDMFGLSVAISGDTIVVGAPEEDSSASGVDGDSSDNGSGAAGAAYVFVREGTTWTQQAYLKASNVQTADRFGGAVAISGDTLVVGARSEDSGSTGVNGNQGNNSAASSGAAYVFVRSGTTWTQRAYLKASNTDSGDGFGTAVAIAGDTIVVTATAEDSSATGVDGDPSDNSDSLAGAAYVFVGSGASWSQQAYLKASNTEGGDNFGNTVAISGDTVAVGAISEDSSASGVDGDGTDNESFHAGAAYVFVRDGTTWSHQAYVKASNTESEDRFGRAVALSGDTLVVSASLEDSNSTGVNGSQANGAGGSKSGAAYMFVRDGTSWTQQAYLKAPDTQNADAFTGDEFGHHLALSGDTLVVGAPNEDGGSTGVNGDPSDNSVSRSGAAHVFDLGAIGETSAFCDAGFALAGVNGDPLLEGTGDLSSGASNSLTLSNAAASAVAGVFAAIDPVAPASFRGGTLVPIPFLALKFATTGATGEIPLMFNTPPGLPSGLVISVQWAITDPAAVLGVSLSNAVKGIVP